MACGYASSIREPKGDFVLCEAKTSQQTREHTYLQYPMESHPCRMEMKEAGWFVVCRTNREVVAVCLYCKKAFTGWNDQHDPYRVHEIFSPNCVFIANTKSGSAPPSPMIESIPRHEEVRPSSHVMAELPRRIKSFEQWPHELARPPAGTLAEAGFFYTGLNTCIECFFCHRQIFIINFNVDLTTAHTNQCQYAGHLEDHPRREPLSIQASDKIYELIDVFDNNMHFYMLRCINASTPAILLSALIPLPTEYDLQTSDRIFKQLRRHGLLIQRVNWKTSSDGPLVFILEELALNPEDLTTQPTHIKSLIEVSSTQSVVPRDNLTFQCKTCLNVDGSPHVVPIKCRHLGLCLKQCFSKWMTCVVCGYTLGKTIRVYGV